MPDDFPELPKDEADIPVNFGGAVSNAIPERLRQWLEAALRQVVRETSDGRRARSILVPTLFAGHANDYASKLIVAIEVQYPQGYDRHIVKLGTDDKVGADEAGWNECTKDRMVASRIFTPVRKVVVNPAINERFYPGDKTARVAVVYRDAYTLFGPGEKERPATLEEVITWAVRDANPDALSAERAVANIFTDLATWFYSEAKVDAAATRRFYENRLKKGNSPATSQTVLERWEQDKSRQELRRDAVWVLALHDAPDADPLEKPARYLDPVEYIRWAQAPSDASRLPPTLVGRSHGDLHGRNILVGVRRGEVEYPAVFDYGDMHADNVLAWDFAKLETELKVRVLSKLLRNNTILAWLLEHGNIRPKPATAPKIGIPSQAAERADRLAAFCCFEELLDDSARRFHTGEEAELLRPLNPPPTGVAELDRLLSILVRIRREAACWLGFRGHRDHDWVNELYYALAVYGLVNVRWNYELPLQEAALISAGVALARMPSTREILRGLLDAALRDPANCPGVVQASDCPTYRLPLAVSYKLWKKPDVEASRKLLEAVAVEIRPPSADHGEMLVARPAMAHAIPLLGQAALLETHVRKLKLVEPFLEKFRRQACEFHDFEMLARIGRLYKEIGDSKFGPSQDGDSRFADPGQSSSRPAWAQMYDKAFHIYRDAHDLTGDWYTGINAATLAALCGNDKDAAEIAENVASICAGKHETEQKDRYWLFATEGEAALILSRPIAVQYYRDALGELSPAQYGMADSSYRQACRLWYIFRDQQKQLAQRVLELFERSDARGVLTHGFMTRQFSGGTP